MNTGLKYLEGRLFTEGGILFMVVETDVKQDLARVSYRTNDQTLVVDMSLRDVSRCLERSSHIILDNINSPETHQRVEQNDHGWFFNTREGSFGHFESEQEAGVNLAQHILRMQSLKVSSRY